MSGPPDPGLIAVEPRVVKELLVDGLFEEAARRAADPPAPELAALLESAADVVGIGPAARGAAGSVARHGYETRRAEREAFPRAREPVAWLPARLADGDAAHVAAELACAEPEGPPDPADPRAAGWRVPGPGGHVRHWIASRAARREAARAEDVDLTLLRRAWYYGFFLGCCEEG